MKKLTTKELVAQNADHLKTLDLKGLFTWSRGQGLDSAAGFSAFKKALLTIGIDYAAMKAGRVAERTAAIESTAVASVTLYSDAKAKNERFGITDKAGRPLWHGRFFSDDRDYNGEQSSGELAAAKKAIWLASKIKEAAGLPGLKVVLKVDAQWLCHGNGAGLTGDDGKGGKARQLGEMAARLGLLLEIEWIPGSENPADQYTICSGFKKWSDNDLAALVEH